MRAARGLAALLVSVALPVHGGPRCAGKLSGAVSGSFSCEVSVTRDAEGKVFVVIAPSAPIEGVPSYAPGAFELPGPPQVRAYTLATLGPGRASVAAEGGTLYSATKTSSERGEVNLAFSRVRGRKGDAAWDVRGTYRARLPAVGGGKSGEVVVEVAF